MRSNRYVILFLLGTQFFAMLAENNRAEQTEMVAPLFGREKLQKIKDVKSLKKHLIARLDKYKRCLVTGPCTKKEMDELWQDIKRTVYAIIFILGSLYLLKRQYKVIEKAGEKPVLWKLPVQYYQIRKKQVKELKKDIKTGVAKGKKLLGVVEGVATGETEVKITTPVGEITGALSPAPQRKQEEEITVVEPKEQAPEWTWWNLVPTGIFTAPEED